MRDASSGVVTLAIFAILIGASGCGRPPQRLTDYDVTGDVFVSPPAPAYAMLVQPCDARRHAVPVDRRGGEPESPNGAWFVVESESLYELRPGAKRLSAPRTLVSEHGDAVATSDFPRVFRLPAPNPLEPVEWVAGHPQRLRYKARAGDDERGSTVDHDIPPELLAPSASKCIH